MEASIKLHGFAGLRDTLRLTRELMVRFWDKGLYPAIEDGPEDRSGPFEWLNDRLVDALIAIPITARRDQGEDYRFVDLLEARNVGSEASFKKDGQVDTTKKKEYEAAIAAGRVSMEMFERAVGETERPVFEDFYADFQQASQEFKALEKTVDEKFGDVPVNLAAFRSSLRAIGEALVEFLPKTKLKKPDQPPPPSDAVDTVDNDAQPSPKVVLRLPLSVPGTGEVPSVSQGSWQEAETLVRSGQVERGLAQMTQLAASETSGRNRFHRKLLLAQVCVASQREALARLILEELAEQIDKFQLEHWESSEMISAVWTALYKIYSKPESTPADPDRARKLYERLCRLDPWQALGCVAG
jgi:hypothetical protein